MVFFSGAHYHLYLRTNNLKGSISIRQRFNLSPDESRLGSFNFAISSGGDSSEEVGSDTLHSDESRMKSLNYEESSGGDSSGRPRSHDKSHIKNFNFGYSSGDDGSAHSEWPYMKRRNLRRVVGR